MTNEPTTNLHCMLYLETMSTYGSSAILAIGAVKFPVDQTIAPAEWDKFHCRVKLSSNEPYARHFSGDTIEWWMSPKQAFARDAIFAMEPMDLSEALDGFVKWYGEWPMPTWGNGVRFDNEIIENAFKATGLQMPWTFWQDRCFRTIKALAPDLEFVSYGTAHVAVDDATSQALHLLKIAAKLGITLR